MSHDLSGKWSGIFNYPHSNPPTAFTNRICSREGRIASSRR